jgi:hypothetical protein
VKLIIEWIRKKPIVAFFVITFAITWGYKANPAALARRVHSDVRSPNGTIGNERRFVRRK